MALVIDEEISTGIILNSKINNFDGAAKNLFQKRQFLIHKGIYSIVCK